MLSAYKKRVRIMLFASLMAVILVAFTFVKWLNPFNKAASVPVVPAQDRISVRMHTVGPDKVGRKFRVVFTIEPKKLPLSNFVVRLDLDPKYVEITGIDYSPSDDIDVLQSNSYTRFYIVMPARGINRLKFYNKKNIANFPTGAVSSFKLSITGHLKKPITSTYRPLRISYLAGINTGAQVYYAEGVAYPEFKLKAYEKNNPPEILSKPQTFAKRSEPYEYVIEAYDKDNDPLTYSLNCPDFVYCPYEGFDQAAAKMQIVNNKLVWKNPDTTTPVRIFVSDGKSVAIQSFTIKVVDNWVYDCKFTVLNPNHKLVEGENSFLVEVSATEPIEHVELVASEKSGTKVTSKLTADGKNQIVDLLKLNLEPGEYKLYLNVYSKDGKVYTCGKTQSDSSKRQFWQHLFPSVYAFGSKEYAQVKQNLAPKFVSHPKVLSMKPGPYSYKLVVFDPDSDKLIYRVVSKPEWAVVKELVNGGGQLELSISGVAKKPGLYVFAVSVSDGIVWRTQTWILNVSPQAGTLPKFEILEPKPGDFVVKGQPIKVKWTDPGSVTGYDLFVSTQYSLEPRKFIAHISPGSTQYTLDTRNLAKSAYWIILIAKRGQAQFVNHVGPVYVGSVPSKINPDPFIKPILITPENGGQVSFLGFEFILKLQASSKGYLKAEDISLKLDDKPVDRSEVIIRPSYGHEVVVRYKPKELLDPGSHTILVTAVDSNKKTLRLPVTFTVAEPKEVKVVDDSDLVEIFGITLSKDQLKWVYISLGGLALAIVLPVALYLAGKGREQEPVESVDIPV